MRARMALVMLSMLLAPMLMQAVNAEATPVATVQTVVASPMVKRKGTPKFSPLRVRNPLFVGDIVHTGPRDKANLLFQDGSQVRLNINTTIEITRPTPTGHGHISLFRAVQGEIWARLRPGNAVRTPHALAGVRGTEFHMKILGDSTTLTVLEGAVEFSNEMGTKLVKRSQQSTAAIGVLPTGPVNIENPEFIIEWTTDIDNAVITREKSFEALDRDALKAELIRCEKALISPPHTAEEHLQYGDTLFDTRRYAEAVNQYRLANQLRPRQSETLVHLGDALLELGEWEAADASYVAAQKFVDNGAKEQGIAALVGRGWVQLSREQPARAEALAEQALIDAGKIGKPKSASDLEMIKTEARVTMGVALLRQIGRQAEAREIFEAVATKGAKRMQYQGYAWLAMLWMGCNHTQNALIAARSAVALAPRSALAHSNLALVSFYRGDMSTAENEAKLSLILNRHSVVAEVVRGQVLLARGDAEGAARVAARAVALDPKMAQAYYLLGIADEQRKDYIHAQRSLKIAHTLAPHYSLATTALLRVTSQGATP